MRSAARAEIGRTRGKRAQPTAESPVVLFGLLLLFLPSLLGAAHARSTPPGTAIVNVATVTAQSSPGGPSSTSPSNPATTLVSSSPLTGLEKRVEPGGTARPGDKLRYTLAFQNASAIDLTGVVIRDPLDPFLAAVADISTGSIQDRGPGGGRVAVSGVHDAAAGEIRWSFPLLPAGFRGEVSFQATLAASIPDESIVRNAFTASSDQDPNGVLSPEVATPVLSPSLTISLAASRDRAEAGDLVGFTIRLGNTSQGTDLVAAQARLVLPEGFRYREGSLRLSGRPAPDPPIARGGRTLEIAAGVLPRGESLDVTVLTAASAGAESGIATARARGTASTVSGIAVEAGPAETALRIVEGVLGSQAVIAGRVWVDDDGNGSPGGGEAGVPGVRLFLEDGTQVVTDVTGRYHFEGVRPGVHVLKIDPESAPPGLEPAGTGLRSSGTSAVQFVDLGASDLFKANFALGGEPEARASLHVEIGWRDEAAVAGASMAGAPAWVYRPPPPPPANPADAPPLLAASLFEPGSATLQRGTEGILESYAQILREAGAERIGVRATILGAGESGLGAERAAAFERAINRLLGVRRSVAPPAPELESVVPAADRDGADPAAAAPGPAVLRATEEVLKALPRGLYLLSPKPGDVIESERVDVEVAFPTDAELRLFVDGERVGEDRVGVRMSTSISRMSLRRFVGVPLVEGENVLAAQIEGGGWPSERIEIRVDRTGAASRIAVRGEGGVQIADGRTPGRAEIEVRDGRGRPVSDGTLVTVEVESGSILGVDADAKTDGFQTRTSGGRAVVRLSPTTEAETRAVRARSGKAGGEGDVRFGPYLRDWILAGVGEAGWSRTGSTAPAAASPEGEADADARLAFFAKGRVGEQSVLSLSFDSARARDERSLFRTQDPARLFPIYGDGSQQAYDLESQGKLAVRWERDRTMLMYGDFRTGLTAADLARYDRPLSGGLVHVEQPKVTLHAFGATTPQRTVRDAILPDGSAGPFRLSRRPLVAYSERVVLEARDRYHTDRILSTSTQDRFTDYDIDYAAGTILFRSAVPTQDDGFNPITIVVTFETLDASGSEIVAGGRIGYHPTARFEWGTTAIHEQRGVDLFTLTGTDVTFRPWPGAAITTEYARVNDGSRTSGAASVRFTASVGSRATVGGFLRDVPADYQNPSMTGVSEIGTRKEGLELRTTLPDGSRLAAETFHEDQAVTGIERKAASVGWERTEGPITYETGAKALGGTVAGSPEDGSSGMLRAGLRARLGRKVDASVARQEVVAGETISGYPTRTDLGAGYRVSDQVRLFMRHEIEQDDPMAGHRSLLGVEGALNDRTTIESRYALEDALAGSRGYATMGVRTRMPLGESWSADSRIERSQTVTGIAAQDFTSLSTAVEHLPGGSKFTSRYEVRFGVLDTRQLLTSAGALKISPDLSLFARQRLSYVEPDAAPSHLDADGLLGLAYRPIASDRFNWLGRIEATHGESLPGGTSSLSAAPQARGLMGVFELNVQPAPKWHLLGRYAGRYARDTFEGLDARTYTEIYETRCLADVGPRVTAGVATRLLRQAATGTTLAGYGAESGFMVARDLWLVAGYNLSGFSDTRFPDGEKRAKGPFISLRFKFDESLLAGLRDAHPPESAKVPAVAPEARASLPIDRSAPATE